MSEHERKTLGKQIKALRIKHRGARSGAEVARAVGIHPQGLYQYERGVNAPSLAALLRLAQAIGCKPGEFLEPFA